MTLVDVLITAAGSGGVGALATVAAGRLRAASRVREAEASERVAVLDHDRHVAPLWEKRLEMVEAKQAKTDRLLDECEDGRAEDREECARRDRETRAAAAAQIEVVRAEGDARAAEAFELLRDVNVEVRGLANKLAARTEDPPVEPTTALHQRLDLIDERAARRSISSQAIPVHRTLPPPVPEEEP